MVDTYSLMFERLRNGDNDTFPSYASSICFLDGHPDLLHIWKNKEVGDQAAIIRLGAYRDGTYCSLFTTEARTDKNWAWLSNGNTISVTYFDSNTGAFIAYEDASFRAKIVTSARNDIKGFIRAGGSNYFRYNKQIVSSTRASLQWEELPGRQNLFIRVVGQQILVFHVFPDSTSVVYYDLVDRTYRKRGDTAVPFKTFAVTTIGVNYVMCLGASELAVIDCTSMEAARFTFGQVPGEIRCMAARFAEDDTTEIYFSTCRENRCSIFKTSLPLQMLKMRFESETFAKGILDLTHRLRTAEMSSEQFGTELKFVHERYAAQEKENTEMKKNMANLQASLESLEKKYNTVLLMLSKKNSGG